MSALAGASGVVLTLVLAIAARFGAAALGAWWMGGAIAPVSPVLCGIVLGLLWRNAIGVGHWTEFGLTRVTQTLLPIGIALVGLRLTLHGVKAVGTLAIPVVIGCILVALTVSAVIGRWLNISLPLRRLIAVGTAVCGCTAVVATAPLVRAKPEETGLALTCVVLFGCLGMLFYPWMAHSLFNENPLAVGVFLGTSIHDTSQVIGASLIYSQEFTAPDTVVAASLTKLLRNLSMLILIPLAAYTMHERAKGKLWVREAIPPFLIAFVVLAVFRNLGDYAFDNETTWQEILSFALVASEFLLIWGMTAVGLSVSLKQLRDIGWRAPALALTVALAVGMCSLVLTTQLSR